jgi:hypothetical protein
MTRLPRRVVLGSLIAALTYWLGADLLHAATCTGSSPCNACKNCKYCGHCAKGGGTCGVCRRAESVR